MDPLIPIISIAVTFALIFILNREGRKMGRHVGPAQSVGIALVVFSFVWLGFYIKASRHGRSMGKLVPLEDVRVTKLIPLEQAYSLHGLPDSVAGNILGLAQFGQGISEDRLEKELKGIYSSIQPEGLVTWAVKKIEHLKKYSAGPDVHSLTLNPKMGAVEKVIFHQLVDAHGIPRQITLLDMILDTYVEQQAARRKTAGSKESVEAQFKRDIARIEELLSDINLQTKPWDRLSLQKSLE